MPIEDIYTRLIEAYLAKHPTVNGQFPPSPNQEIFKEAVRKFYSSEFTSTWPIVKNIKLPVLLKAGVS